MNNFPCRISDPLVEFSAKCSLISNMAPYKLRKKEKCLLLQGMGIKLKGENYLPGS